jgi:hypothetical protein
VKQIHCFRLGTNLPTSSNWTPLFGLINIRSFESQSLCGWAVAGTFRNFKMHLDTAPGSGQGWQFIPRINLADSSVSWDIDDTATEGQDLVNEITVAPGDFFALRWIATGSPANPSGGWLSFEFESDNPNESGYSQASGTASNTLTQRSGVFWAAHSGGAFDTWNTTATPAADLANIVPTAGAITAAHLHLESSPGGGSKAFEAVIYKAVAASPTSFVKQDGTGGTIDTRVTCTGTDINEVATFTLPVADGDRVYCELTPLNTPNNGLLISVAYCFTATVDGESIVGGLCHLDISNGGTYYATANAQIFQPSATESAVVLGGSPSSFTLAKFHLGISATPGSGNSWVWTGRVNSATPAGSLTVTLADSDIYDTDLSNSLAVADGDTFDFQIVAVSGPTASVPSWSMVQTVQAPQILGSFVLGAGGTIAGSTLTGLVNLDGVTRTISKTTIPDLPGSLYLGGNLIIAESASPPAGVATAARIYAEDNGAGKTRLMVQFATGVPQQIAIEP